MENIKLDTKKIPKHVAIIMDGNGRWAKTKGLTRLIGHENGVGVVREIVEAASKIGVEYLTLYTFSKENWNRPLLEVSGLMNLLVKTIKKEIKTLIEQKVRLKTIGDITTLDQGVQDELKEAIIKTKDNKKITLVLALNYSSKWDITNAVKDISIKVQNGELELNKIDSTLISKSLSTAFLPEPELIIRTGGEKRVSNFLLWEAAYSEFYFTPVFWPDFKELDFFEAIYDFQNRERRFGKISEQITQ